MHYVLKCLVRKRADTLPLILCRNYCPPIRPQTKTGFLDLVLGLKNIVLTVATLKIFRNYIGIYRDAIFTYVPSNPLLEKMKMFVFEWNVILRYLLSFQTAHDFPRKVIRAICIHQPEHS